MTLGNAFLYRIKFSQLELEADVETSMYSILVHNYYNIMQPLLKNNTAMTRLNLFQYNNGLLVVVHNRQQIQYTICTYSLQANSPSPNGLPQMPQAFTPLTL